MGVIAIYGFTALVVLGRVSIGRTPWTGDHPVASLLPTQENTEPQNKRT
jgi:hypothetical protein